MVEIQGKLHAACPWPEMSYKGGYDKIKAVNDFVESKGPLAYGHSRASECDYIFVHEKGNKDIFALMKVEDILNREEVTDEMRPSNWPSIEDLEQDKFFLISKVKFINIPFSELRDKNGIELEPTALNDMTKVEAEISEDLLK